MQAIARSTAASLAISQKHEQLKTSVLKTTKGAQGAYQTFIYKYVPTKKAIDSAELMVFQYMTEGFKNFNDWVDNLVFDEPLPSESYRHVRILYDAIIEAKRTVKIEPLSAHQKGLLPKHRLELLDAVWAVKTAVEKLAERIEVYLGQLDKSVESYQSLYFGRLSEKEVWESRCKAYKYRI